MWRVAENACRDIHAIQIKTERKLFTCSCVLSELIRMKWILQWNICRILSQFPSSLGLFTFSICFIPHPEGGVGGVLVCPIESCSVYLILLWTGRFSNPACGTRQIKSMGWVLSLCCREINSRICWRRLNCSHQKTRRYWMYIFYHVWSAFVSYVLKHKAEVELPEGSIYPKLCHTSRNPKMVHRPSFLKMMFAGKYPWACRVHDPLVSSFRDELRLGPSQPGASHKYGPLSNGAAGRRSTLIEPERLKDFGEEELLNGDVRVHETRMVEAPEIKLMDPPKTRRLSEFRTVPRPPLQYLRFEDISAAAFRIQSGIQKTPCTVGLKLHDLSLVKATVVFWILHKYSHSPYHLNN